MFKFTKVVIGRLAGPYFNMDNAMTTAVIIITVVAWVLLSALFLIAACVLSARLRSARVTPDDPTKSVWARQEGEVPTTPVSTMR